MKIGVVGTRGGWSSELLADTMAAKTGFRLLVDMEQVCMDLDAGTVWTEGERTETKRTSSSRVSTSLTGLPRALAAKAAGTA